MKEIVKHRECYIQRKRVWECGREVTIGSVSKRDDCTEMTIPRDAVGYVTGNRGSELRRVESRAER